VCEYVSVQCVCEYVYVHVCVVCVYVCVFACDCHRRTRWCVLSESGIVCVWVCVGSVCV